MVRNKENHYNWKGSSPTTQEITWFVLPLFVQAYDTYKKHPEKTHRPWKDRQSDHFLASKTTEDPADHENRLPSLQNHALHFSVLAVPKINLSLEQSSAKAHSWEQLGNQPLADRQVPFAFH